VLGLSKEEAEKKSYIASMGVYISKKDIHLNLLRYVYRIIQRGFRILLFIQIFYSVNLKPKYIIVRSDGVFPLLFMFEYSIHLTI